MSFTRAALGRLLFFVPGWLPGLDSVAADPQLCDGPALPGISEVGGDMQADQVAPLDRPAAAVANDPSPAPHNPAQVAPAPNRPGAYPAERQAAVQTRPQPGCEPTNRCFCRQRLPFTCGTTS